MATLNFPCSMSGISNDAAVAEAAGALLAGAPLVAGAPLDDAAVVGLVVGVDPAPHAARSKTALMATPNTET
jgi:hypothetical protein